MTFRAVVLGLLLAAAVAAVSYFNDIVINQSAMVSNYMPTAMLVLLIVLALVVNPVLSGLRRGLGLSGKELAAILMMLLVAGPIASDGLMRYFTNMCMMPHAIGADRVVWQKHGVIKLIPPQMLADPTVNDGRSLTDFLAGRPVDSQRTGLGIVPWEAWSRTLWFWMPLLVSLLLGLMGLALVLHQQWSVHERLRYPVATLAAAFMPDEGQTLGAVFRRGEFWLGTLVVFGCYMVNYLHAWWPLAQPFEIPLGIDLRPMNDWWRIWRDGQAGDALMQPQVVFTAVGFAFLLASDLSLSLALAPIAFTIAVGTFVTAGVNIEGPHMTATIGEFMYAGAWAGMGLMVLYTGRRFYTHTLRAALLPRPGKPDASIPSFSVWGLRMFLAGAAVFVFLLTRTGLDVYLAILYALAATMTFVVLSRIVAETGAFSLHPWHFPAVTIFGFLGIDAIGPRNYIIMLIVTSVILMDPKVSLMPLVVQGLKIAQLKGLPPGRTAALGVPALLIALAVAVPVTLYWQYDKGVNASLDAHNRDWMPQFAISAFLNMKETYEAAHDRPLQDVNDGRLRFDKILPDKRLMLAFGTMLGLVLLFATARLRFPWWPLHPILFVMLGTWETKIMAFSFGLGWLAKVAATHLGGHRMYEKLKPMMIGLIAGEVLSAGTRMVVGALYYMTMGHKPEFQ
ncbi:MAG: hypothetical protein NTV86_05840 [Planctomycetota bacterium]|nr:hypothetical protein [Planctomycetota bacterium]